ncbi:uncharacterized protein LOC128234511 isoform X2 [Mya arenaria]|uniref:uncharacterized protein LOC128234511 isoform X2 n=1 Tax=Mya arenaria TaxID=6604 RepID=UPI0022E7C525|nr:uncharacterized protein LOC128234511 isoform X2 [Mya arenaria]
MATNVEESKNVSKRSAKKVKEVDLKLSAEHITLTQECRIELEQFASQRKDFLQIIGDIDDRDTTEDNNEEVILNTISSYLLHAFKQYDKIASNEVLYKVREKLGDVIAETGTVERLCVYVNNALNKMVKPTTGDVTVTSTLHNVLKVLANYSDGSMSLCQELAENRSYLKACQQFLARKDICKRIKANNTLKDDDPGSDFLDCLLTTLHNIASRDELALSMQKVGFTDALKFHLSNTNRNVWMQVLAILAAVVTEDECDIIKSNHKRVGELLSVLEHGLEQEDLRYEGWSCFEVAHTIRVLARNDANKRMLVQTDAFKLLVALAKTGGKREKMESIQSLWVLCFDKDNKEEAINNKELGIKDLLTDLKVYKDKDIANTSVRVLWILRDVFETSSLKRTQTFEKDKHIMLSYNHQHREIMMQIKAELRRHGFTVWMDVDNISGSTLESMAKAVEEAAIILICMSQLYKDSNYCRAAGSHNIHVTTWFKTDFC